MTKQQKILHYQCSCCHKVHTQDEWNASTLKEVLTDLAIDPEEMNLVPIEETEFFGWNWFTCPSCNMMHWDRIGEIILISDFMKTNRGAKSLLEKDW